MKKEILDDSVRSQHNHHEALAVKWLYNGLVGALPLLLTRVLFTIISSILSILFIIALQKIVDSLVSGSSDKVITSIKIIIFISGLGIVVSFIAQQIKSYSDIRIGISLSKGIIESIFGKTNITEKFTIGDIINRLQQSTRIHIGLCDTINKLIRDIVFITIFILYSSYVNIYMLFIIFTMFPLTFCVARVSSRLLQKPVEQQMIEQSSYSTEIIVGLQNIETLITLHEQNYWRNRTVGKLKQLVSHQKTINYISSYSQTANTFILRMVEVAVLSYGSYMVLYQNMTPGHVLAFYLLTLRISNPLAAISSAVDTWKVTKISLRRLGELLNSSANALIHPSSRVQWAGPLSINDASMTIRSQTVVEVNQFHVGQGDCIHIHGDVGVGKTSFLKGLCGLISDVRLSDSIVLHDTPNSHSDICYLGRNSFLFDGSLSDNVFLDYSREGLEIDQLAAQYGLSDIFKGMKDTQIRADGVGLSSGQSQAVNLLRGALRGPKVLVLDEATSNLDPVSEEKFIRSFIYNHPNSAVIFTSHRKPPAGMEIISYHMTMAADKGLIQLDLH